MTKRSGVTIAAVTAETPRTAGGTPVEEQTPEQRRALFRVVRGAPDDAEVAALTLVLAAVAAGSAAAPADERGRSVWVDRAAMLRTSLHPGPGAWRNSVRPR